MSEFVARQRAGKKEWRENNLGIGNAWKYQEYKQAVCKTEDKVPFVPARAAIAPADKQVQGKQG